MPPAIKRLSDESGYSLVEVIASILVMAIAIIPMVAMFDTGLNLATSGSNYDKARMLADANLERVRSLSYSQARITYTPTNATPVAGPIVPCNESMLPAGEQAVFDCDVETTYVDGELNPSSTSINRMLMVVTVTWGPNDTTYTTSGLVAR